MWQWVVSGAAAVSLSYSGTTTIEVLVGVLRCVEEEGKGKQAKLSSRKSKHCTKVQFSSLQSGGFITAIILKPPERKLAKRTSVHCLECVKLLCASSFHCLLG